MLAETDEALEGADAMLAEIQREEEARHLLQFSGMQNLMGCPEVIYFHYYVRMYRFLGITREVYICAIIYVPEKINKQIYI